MSSDSASGQEVKEYFNKLAEKEQCLFCAANTGKVGDGDGDRRSSGRSKVQSTSDFLRFLAEKCEGNDSFLGDDQIIVPMEEVSHHSMLRRLYEELV